MRHTVIIVKAHDMSHISCCIKAFNKKVFLLISFMYVLLFCLPLFSASNIIITNLTEFVNTFLQFFYYFSVFLLFYTFFHLFLLFLTFILTFFYFLLRLLSAFFHNLFLLYFSLLFLTLSRFYIFIFISV